MREIIGATAEENKLIKAIQKKMKILDNGVIGTDTMTSIAATLGADCFPIAITMYGCPTVVGKKVIPFNPRGGIQNWSYTMSGSFTEPRFEYPCSICVNEGSILFAQACHYWTEGKPESAIYQMPDGSFGIKRVLQISELPNGFLWAVGGMGLLDNWAPEVEGFDGSQSGVHRRTGHIVLGYKNGLIYGVAFKNHTSRELNSICRDYFMFEGAILLDGGSVFQYNIGPFQKDVKQRCGYAIQFE